MSKFGVGVLGATGYIGTPYRAEIRDSPDDARIVALCARRRELLEAAAKEDGAALVTDDWRGVVEHPEVDLVLVCTPDSLHHEAMMACAKLGKHVLCEKPTGINVAQSYEMWSAYRDTNLGHFVPYWTRYQPQFVRAREIFREGLLGEIQAVVYRWHNPRPESTPFTWRDDATISSAGSIADVGSHAYDAMCWILGQEVTRVLTHAKVIMATKPDLGDVNLEEALQRGGDHSADQTEKTRQTTAHDYASIAMEFENGAVGTLILSHAPTIRKGLGPELELHGSKASLGVDRMSGKISLARPEEDVELIETIEFPGWGNRFSQYVFPALRQRIAGQRCEHPGLEEGWRVQRFTDAAAHSAQRGAWVELAELDA